MFNSITLGTRDLGRAGRFYDATMATGVCAPFNGEPASVGNGSMVGLVAKSWSQVDAFHAAALAHGGASEGEPGLRLH